ncbi:MAG: phosphatidylglycerophosphatase A [Fidelibacterota bacterium]
MKKAVRSLSGWIATVFLIGYLPLAPGTWASFLALIVWYFLPVIEIVNYGILLILIFAVGVVTAQHVSVYSQKTDPSEVVIDEWLGMWIALYAIPKVITWMIVSFLFFRFFDIFKVSPVNKLERMHGGWGIMMDDVAAGFYTLGLTHLLIWIIR